MIEPNQTFRFGDLVSRRTATWSPGDEAADYVGLEHILPHELCLAGRGSSDEVTSGKTRFCEGDVLFGKLRPYFRKVVRPDFAGICSTDIWALYSDDEAILDSGYLHWIIADSAFSEFANSAETGTRMPRAAWQWVSTYEVSLPPLNEQRRIAEVLEALDDRISQVVQLSLSLEEELQALFDVLVDRDSQEVTLADIALVNPHMVISGGSEAPYVPMERVSTSGYRIKGATPRVVGSGARFRNGDTLVARITPSLENGKVGFVDLLHGEEVGWGSTEFIVLRGKTHIDPFIPYLIARSDGFRDYAVRHMSGSSGRQRCPAEAVERFRSLVPSDDGLGRFASDSASRRQALKRFNDEAQLTRELRNVLLPRLISGDLRVAEAEELVEAAT